MQTSYSKIHHNLLESVRGVLRERELSPAEKKKKEDVVKDLKKHKSDFEDRYGKDAESVMHAVATKRAKNEELGEEFEWLEEKISTWKDNPKLKPEEIKIMAEFEKLGFHKDRYSTWSWYKSFGGRMSDHQIEVEVNDTEVIGTVKLRFNKRNPKPAELKKLVNDIETLGSKL